MKEYFVELDHSCSYEEDHNESVTQSMAMDVDNSAPFLQGPAREGDGSGPSEGDDGDGDSASQNSTDDDSNDSSDGSESEGGDPKKSAPKRKGAQQPKLEPCEERAINRMYITTYAEEFVFFGLKELSFLNKPLQEIENVSDTLKQILSTDGKMQSLIRRLKDFSDANASEFLDLPYDKGNHLKVFKASSET